MKLNPILMLVFLASIVFVSTLAAHEDKTDAGYMSYLPVTAKPVKPLFFDNFSDPNSGWPVEADANISRSYQGGEYEVLIHTGKWQLVTQAPRSGFTDYAVEAEMRRLVGSTSAYGLVFDFQDLQNYYYLVVDPGAQWYIVAKKAAGNPAVALVPQTNSSLINPGDENNFLRVERVGDQIAFYANGENLTTINNAGFGGGLGVGLFSVEWGGNPPSVLRYDNFAVWNIGSGASTKLELGLRSNDSPAIESGGTTFVFP